MGAKQMTDAELQAAVDDALVRVHGNSQMAEDAAERIRHWDALEDWKELLQEQLRREPREVVPEWQLRAMDDVVSGRYDEE